MPESPPNHSSFFPDVYRYAFLMTGSAATATEVLRSTVDSASRGLRDDDAKSGRAKRWLFAKAREFCRHPQLLRPIVPTAVTSPGSAAAVSAVASTGGTNGTSHPLSPEETPLPTVPAVDDASNAPNRLAAYFALLPEQERSALILFYLYLFEPAELAEVLEIKAGELGHLLSEARTLLQQHKVECAGLLAQAFAAPVAVTPD
jgi:DNA-directed RNA polymerase specialized sigma24 family protein